MPIYDYNILLELEYHVSVMAEDESEAERKIAAEVMKRFPKHDPKRLVAELVDVDPIEECAGD